MLATRRLVLAALLAAALVGIAVADDPADSVSIGPGDNTPAVANAAGNNNKKPHDTTPQAATSSSPASSSADIASAAPTEKVPDEKNWRDVIRPSKQAFREKMLNRKVQKDVTNNQPMASRKAGKVQKDVTNNQPIASRQAGEEQKDNREERHGPKGGGRGGGKRGRKERVPGENSLKDMTKEERHASRQAQKEQKMKEREARAKMTPEQRKADREARKAERRARREERKTKDDDRAAETTIASRNAEQEQMKNREDMTKEERRASRHLLSEQKDNRKDMTKEERRASRQAGKEQMKNKKDMTKEERRASRKAEQEQDKKDREARDNMTTEQLKAERAKKAEKKNTSTNADSKADKIRREARAKMTPEQRKADREAKVRAKKEEKKTKATAAAETTRKAHAISAAIMDPVAPKAVTFPLSEEDEILFSASRKGMLAYAKTKVDKYDLDKEGTRDSLQQKAQDNEDKTLELVVAAVKSGSTIQQARVGLAIAQFQALGTQHGAQALVDEYTEKARTRRSKIPEEAKRKVRIANMDRHTEELGKMKNFKDETDKEQWVRRSWKADKVSKRKQPKTEEPKGTKK